MSRSWVDSLHGETWSEKVDKMNIDINSNAIRNDLDISLTDKELINLKLMAYKAGLSGAGQLISAFVGDLTGWHPSGSDEREIAQNWYGRTFGTSDFYSFFKFHLYDYDYSLEDMKDMLVDPEFFNNVYEDYKAESTNKKPQSHDECRQELKNIIEKGIEL